MLAPFLLELLREAFAFFEAVLRVAVAAFGFAAFVAVAQEFRFQRLPAPRRLDARLLQRGQLFPGLGEFLAALGPLASCGLAHAGFLRVVELPVGFALPAGDFGQARVELGEARFDRFAARSQRRGTELVVAGVDAHTAAAARIAPISLGRDPLAAQLHARG